MNVGNEIKYLSNNSKWLIINKFDSMGRIMFTIKLLDGFEQDPIDLLESFLLTNFTLIENNIIKRRKDIIDNLPK